MENVRHSRAILADFGDWPGMVFADTIPKNRAFSVADFRLTSECAACIVKSFVPGKSAPRERKAHSSSTSTRVRLCFHDRCFDGTASAALFYRFYRERFDSSAEFHFSGMAHRAAQPWVARSIRRRRERHRGLQVFKLAETDLVV